MIPDYDKILAFVKESTRTFFIVGGTSAALIFFSDQMGTQSIRDAINPFLKVVLLICCLGVIYTIFEATIKVVKSSRQQKQRKQNLIRRIENLTEYEKFILEEYVKDGVRNKSLNSNDGSVVELERSGIIFQSTGYMDHGSNCQYNVSDWAWEYIKVNPEVVREKT